MFRYLSKEENTKVESGALSKEDATRMNDERRVAAQKRMAENFVANAENLRNNADSRMQNDLQQLKRYMEQSDSAITALDLFLYNRADYRAALNQLNKDNERAQIDYSVTAALAGENEYADYQDNARAYSRATVLTSDNPGVANTVDVTIAQSIIYRAESQGLILPLIAKVTVPFGDYEEPYYNKYAMAGYLAEDGTIPDIQSALNDATDGIKKRKWTPRDFAFGLEQSLRSLKKLSPSILNQILGFVSQAMTRGMEYQVVSGPGTGNTDTGIRVNATAVAFETDVYRSFVNACAECESKNAMIKVGIMNAKCWAQFKKLKVTNEAYRDVIDTANRKIDDVQIIVVAETLIPTTGTTTKSTEFVVGQMDHYLAVTTGGLDEYVDTDAKNLKQFTAFHTLRDGKPRFNDSFAKVTVTVQ